MLRSSKPAITGATVILVLGSHAALGADESAAVLVTATRYQQALDTVLPASIVIERDELQRSLAPDIADVLRFYSGIEFGRYGGPGQTASIFMRGTESNHTLILIDGVRVNPGTIGGAALQDIPPELVQRIEVVKGPRSSLYGTDAIGGVVQIFTHARHATGVASEAGYGSDNTVFGSVNAGWSSDVAHLGIGVNYLDTDGFAPRTNDPRGGAYDNLSVNLAGNLAIGAGDLAVTYWNASGNVDYIGFSERTFGNGLITQEHTNEAGNVSYAWELGAWQSRVELGRMVEDIEQGRIEDALGDFESDDFATTRRNSIGWQNDIDLSAANRLSAGVMYYDESADTLSFGEIDTGVTNLYVQERLALERHTFVLALGYVDHEAFGSHTTWNAEYGLRIGADTRAIAAAGTAFRAPDATDRFGFGGNPDLEPEESLNYELGLRHSLAARQQLFANIFQNDIDELIEYVVTDPDTFDGELRNVERARVRGVEAGYEIDANDWRLRIEGIWQQPENRTTGEQLLRRAQRNFTVSYVQRFGSVELGGDVLAAGDREDFGGEQLDAYVLANLTARYNFGAGWSATARLENAFDADYEHARGYRTPGRTLFVALRYAPR